MLCSARTFGIGALCTILAAAGCSSSAEHENGADLNDADAALASAAGRVVATTLRSSVLSSRPAGARIRSVAGDAHFDTLLIEALRSAEPDIWTEPSDSTTGAVLTTNGVSYEGDTATVVVVVRTCASGDSTLSFTRDSLVHRLVRAADDNAQWKLAEPVMHEQSIGTCQS